MVMCCFFVIILNILSRACDMSVRRAGSQLKVKIITTKMIIRNHNRRVLLDDRNGHHHAGPLIVAATEVARKERKEHRSVLAFGVLQVEGYRGGAGPLHAWIHSFFVSLSYQYTYNLMIIRTCHNDISGMREISLHQKC